MKIVSAEFVRSALQPSSFPRDRRPEFAFVGRSNVGKSTLLNTLLNRKGLAKVSKTPGKTRSINFFEVNQAFYFVDLPGYGYAKVSKALKDEWRRALTGYLREREPLRLAVQLIDARHSPMASDLEMLELLEEAKKPTLIVATKFDKVKPSQRANNLRAIQETLGLDEDAMIVPFSAVSGEGKKEIWRIIEDLLG